MKALSIVLLLLATQAHAAPPTLGQSTAPFSAHEANKRARVGTHSPRLSPCLRVEIEPRSARFRATRYEKSSIQQKFDRMDCRLESSTDSIVCKPKRAEEVNLYKKPR